MKINVHIERLILEGLPVTTLQGSKIQRAVEGELTRLLTWGGLSDELRSGIAVPQVRAGAIHLSKETAPDELGRGIAQAVYGGIGRTR
jgi:hypothetical protein